MAPLPLLFIKSTRPASAGGDIKMADKIAMPEPDEQTGLIGFDSDLKIEQSWPRSDGAEGEICTTVFKVVTLNQDFGCAICGERIPAGLPMFMTRSPGLGTDYLLAMCPTHARAMGMVLAAEYDNLNRPPLVPPSMDDIEEQGPDPMAMITRCLECGGEEITETYRTYANVTTRFTHDDKGNVEDATASFPRVPDQDPGDLASIQCEGCMVTLWCNPYL